MRIECRLNKLKLELSSVGKGWSILNQIGAENKSRGEDSDFAGRGTGGELEQPWRVSSNHDCQNCHHENEDSLNYFGTSHEMMFSMFIEIFDMQKPAIPVDC